MVRAEWSDEDVAELKKLWAAGLTAEAIGKRLGGLSRAAVLGKVFRLRLPAAPNNNRAAPGGNKAAAAVAAKKSAAPARRRGLPPPEPVTEPRPKSLFDLTNHCCRWPYRRPGADKYFFCGAPEADLEAGIPYCPRHMQRAYLIPPPRIPQALRPQVLTRPGKVRVA